MAQLSEWPDSRTLLTSSTVRMWTGAAVLDSAAFWKIGWCFPIKPNVFLLCDPSSLGLTPNKDLLILKIKLFRFVLNFYLFIYFSIVYVVERGAQLSGPLIRVERVRCGGRWIGWRCSIFSCVCRGRGGGGCSFLSNYINTWGWVTVPESLRDPDVGESVPRVLLEWLWDLPKSVG